MSTCTTMWRNESEWSTISNSLHVFPRYDPVVVTPMEHPQVSEQPMFDCLPHQQHTPKCHHLNQQDPLCHQAEAHCSNIRHEVMCAHICPVVNSQPPTPCLSVSLSHTLSHSLSLSDSCLSAHRQYDIHAHSMHNLYHSHDLSITHSSLPLFCPSLYTYPQAPHRHSIRSNSSEEDRIVCVLEGNITLLLAKTRLLFSTTPPQLSTIVVHAKRHTENENLQKAISLLSGLARSSSCCQRTTPTSVYLHAA